MNSGLKIGRRTALKGMGVTLGLPLLEAMAPAKTAVAAAGKPPLRMIFLYIPGGVNVDAWRPGAGLSSEPSLEPGDVHAHRPATARSESA